MYINIMVVRVIFEEIMKYIKTHEVNREFPVGHIDSMSPVVLPNLSFKFHSHSLIAMVLLTSIKHTINN